MLWTVPDIAIIGNTFGVATRDIGEQTSVPVNVDYITTGGFSSVGDGGAAVYQRSALEPDHAGKFQSADGSWWALFTQANSSLALNSFSADPNGIVDSTAAIVGAEDFATKVPVVPNTINTPNLTFDGGNYLVGSITKQSYGWVGAGKKNTRLTFNGVGGEDFITQGTLTAGRNSAAALKDMTIYGDDCRDILSIPVNANNFGVDDEYQHSVQFLGGARYQVYLQGYVNYHQQFNRHDNYGVAAIYVLCQLSMNLRSFSYGNFTSDNNVGGGGQATNEGLIVIDNSIGASNIGVVHIHDARIEFNKAAAGRATADASKAFVFKSICDAAGNQQIKWTLRDLAIASSTAGDVLCVFYRNAGGTTTGSDTILMENVQISGVTNLFAGDWPAWMKAIPVGNYQTLVGDSLNGIWAKRVTTGGPTGWEFYGPDLQGTGTVMGFTGSGLANKYWNINYQGVITSGSGAVAPTIMMRPGGATGWTNPTDYGAGFKTDVTLLPGGSDLATTVAAVIDLQKRLSTLTRVLHTVGNIFGFLRV